VEARPDEYAVARLREQFQSDLLEGAYDIEPRLASEFNGGAMSGGTE